MRDTPIISKKKFKLYIKKNSGKNWGKNQIYQINFINKNTNHGGNNNQNREIRNTSFDYTKHGKYYIDIIPKPNQKIFGQRMHRD